MLLARKGLHNGYRVLCRRLRLKWFCRGQNVASTLAHFLAQSFDLLTNLVWRAKGNGALRAETTPERDLVSPFPLEVIGVHVPGFRLDALQDVQPDLDDVRHDVVDAAAAVRDHEFTMGMNSVIDAGIARLEQLAPALRADDDSPLIAPVIAKHDGVNIRKMPASEIDVREELLRNAIHEFFDEIWLGDNVHEDVLEPSHIPARLKESPSEPAYEEELVLLLLAELAGLGYQLVTSEERFWLGPLVIVERGAGHGTFSRFRPPGHPAGR